MRCAQRFALLAAGIGSLHCYTRFFSSKIAHNTNAGGGLVHALLGAHFFPTQLANIPIARPTTMMTMRPARPPP